jgi:ubiquinone/menaquinone biosynthesis C-methylase UbiE
MNSTKQKFGNSYSDVLACVHRANALLKSDKVTEAKGHIEKALSLDRNNPHLLTIYKRLSSLADNYYGDVGFFKITHPITNKYTYANWGSRKWEYYYVEKLLNEIDIENKQVVDIGIGIPSEHNFYTNYVRSNCNLTAFDPDGRLDEITMLSQKCCIVRQSAEQMEMTSNSVDVVVSISSFEHFPVDVFKRTIREIHRILKDDGHLVITLDLTYDKKSSAVWAILEKTLNGFPAKENDCQLQGHHQQLTLEYFLELISPYFYPEDTKIYNKEIAITKRMYSAEWNSHIAYLHLRKRPGNNCAAMRPVQYNTHNLAGQELCKRIKKFNKIVIWGLKTSDHSHAHIHRHFYETLKKLEIDACWVDDNRRYEELIRKGDMVIAVDVACSSLPIREGVCYCLHNCYKLYKEIEPSRSIVLQTYRSFVEQDGSEKWDDVTFFHRQKRILSQPWATDLLGEEFKEPVFKPETKTVYWVGSIWNDDQDQGNINEIQILKNVLKKRNIELVWLKNISDSQNIKYVRLSRIAPAIAGRWQVEHNYLPCRMWKNISYGQLGISNVKKFDDIFKDCIVKGQGIEEIIDNALSLSLDKYRDMIFEQQQIVKKNHTYANRLLGIVRAFDSI